MEKKKILKMAQFSILLAIEAVFCFVPALGSIPITPMVVATLAMIPIIITSIILGTKTGSIMGAIAGVFRIAVWTFMTPNPMTAFIFTPFYTAPDAKYSGGILSVAVSLGSCILVGFVSGLLFNTLKKYFGGNKDIINYAVCGITGSLVNTFWVLGGMRLFFADKIADVLGDSILNVLYSIFIFNAIPEFIVCMLVVPAVCKAVSVVIKEN